MDINKLGRKCISKNWSHYRILGNLRRYPVLWYTATKKSYPQHKASSWYRSIHLCETLHDSRCRRSLKATFYGKTEKKKKRDEFILENLGFTDELQIFWLSHMSSKEIPKPPLSCFLNSQTKPNEVYLFCYIISLLHCGWRLDGILTCCSETGENWVSGGKKRSWLQIHCRKSKSSVL